MVRILGSQLIRFIIERKKKQQDSKVRTFQFLRMSQKTEILKKALERILEHGHPEKITQVCLDEITIESFDPQINKIIEKCQNVVHLSISSCGLIDLKSFPRIKNLRYLDLQNNLFTDNNLIDLANQLQTLDGLNISKNSIQSIDILIHCSNKLSLKELNIFETPLLETFPKCIEKLFENCKTLQCIDWQDKIGKQVIQYDRSQSSNQSQNQDSQKQYSQDQSNQESISGQSSKKVKVQ